MGKTIAKYELPGQKWKFPVFLFTFIYLALFTDRDTPLLVVVVGFVLVVAFIVHSRVHHFRWRSKQLRADHTESAVFQMYGRTTLLSETGWMLIGGLWLIVLTLFLSSSFEYPGDWTVLGVGFVFILLALLEFLYFGKYPSKKIVLFEDRIYQIDKMHVAIEFADVKDFDSTKKYYSFVSDDNTPLKIFKREYTPGDRKEFEEKLRIVMDYWEKKKAYSYR